MTLSLQKLAMYSWFLWIFFRNLVISFLVYQIYMGQKHQPYYTMAFGVVSEVEQPQQYTSIMLHQLRPPLNMLSISDCVRKCIAELGIKTFSWS